MNCEMFYLKRGATVHVAVIDKFTHA